MVYTRLCQWGWCPGLPPSQVHFCSTERQVTGVLISSFLYDSILFPVFARAEGNKPVLNNISNDYISYQLTLGLRSLGYFFSPQRLKMVSQTD